MKKWQRTFFYVSNPDPARDGVNLPEFLLAPPIAKQNWNMNSGLGDAEIDNILARIRTLQENEGLVAGDLVTAFIAHRVQPLQKRLHRICDMSLHRDPTRTSTVDLTHRQVVERVNAIADLKLPSDWWFGKEPYCRNLPAPQVSD